DTNICIYFLNQDKSVTEKMSKISVDDMAISIITIAELQFGAFNSSKIRENLERIKYLRNIIKTIDLNTTITEEYERIKSSLRKSGNLIDDFDILIGSTAIVNKLILVTNNQQHFNRIDNLLIENWK
ncbi:MAG: PIN domain-containing protein, partial [Treponema sp.]|nr:PIN domain-containing protein [Treponema sp.]